MPFNLSQIFGGWRRKEKGIKRALRTADEISRRGRAPERTQVSEGRDKEISDAARGAQAKGQSELAWKLIVAPHISEKATALGDARYVFKIADTATKSALKRAVEDRYGVEVLSVNMIQARSKKRRRGSILGEKSGFKKAVVTLKIGQTISEF